MDKKIEDMNGFEMALALQARYLAVAQCQQEIWALNQAIEKNMKNTEKPKDE